MGDAVGGRERVGEHIDRLRERYGDFAVNQTTVTVPADGYERAVARADDGIVDAYVRVWNDEGEAYHLRCEPAFRIGDDQGARLEAGVRASVREATDIDATIENVGRVTIAGIRNEDDVDAPAVYRLFVLFDANHHGGASPEEIEWDTDVGVVPEFVSNA